MANIMNPKPRFGLNVEANTIFDYVSSRDVPITPKYQAIDGQWDLTQVKALILAGKTIESAKLNNTVPPAPVAPKPALKAAPRPGQPIGSHAPAPAPVAAKPSAPAAPAAAPTKSLTAAHIQDLKLAPLQLAALGITAKQLKVSGLTAQELAAMKMSPARAKLLNLSAQQEAALTS